MLNVLFHVFAHSVYCEVLLECLFVAVADWYVCVCVHNQSVALNLFHLIHVDDE